jgi:hypothetical protein
MAKIDVLCKMKQKKVMKKVFVVSSVNVAALESCV